MPVLATAGHVDHGKSALVIALSGIDPDRLKEEKERGMTIDLGFAWMSLPSGVEVGIVDVPGHERFIRNMLSGVGSIRVVLFVVAGNEGMRPQSLEHLSILNLLNVRHGVLAITKKDLIDSEKMEIVKNEIEEKFRGSSLEKIPRIEVSCVSGEGIKELKNLLSSVFDSLPEEKTSGHPRLWIDRVFILKGIGTVVTGTLIDGKLSINQEVEILPSGIRSKIKGLQSHKRSLRIAEPGNRVAINLGGIGVEELERGNLICEPGKYSDSKVIHAKVKILDELKHEVKEKVLKFHIGTLEVEGKLEILSGKVFHPGEEGYCQITFRENVFADRFDRFILRDASRREIVGGGEILDILYERVKRKEFSVIEKSLRLQEEKTPAGILMAELSRRNFLKKSDIAKIVDISLSELVRHEKIIVLGEFVILKEKFEKLKEEIINIIKKYHREKPLRSGMPKEQARSEIQLQKNLFDEIIHSLVEDGEIFAEGGEIRLSSHEIVLSNKERDLLDTLLSLFEDSPFSPPTLNILISDKKIDNEIIQVALKGGYLVKVSEDLVFKKEHYEIMKDKVLRYICENGSITVAKVRDIFQTSRKYALPFLEHLDSCGITQRIGDERVLKK